MSRNLFIDCGTNLGQALKAFDKKYNLFNNPKWYIIYIPSYYTNY